LLRKRGDAEGAVASFEQALKSQPVSPVALANLGHALQDRADATRGDMQRAEECYAQVLRLNPTDQATLNSLGTIYMALGRFEDAAKAFRQGLAMDPNSLDARSNLGGALHELGLFSESQSEFERVLALRPNFADAHFNLGITQLLTGDFERGWAGYAWRARSPLEPKNKPRWDGSSLAGKTILLYPEQGMGDTLQFIRFAAVLKQRGARVMFGCPAPLLRLLQSCEGIDVLLPDRAPLPPFDCYARLLDLPGLLEINLSNLPAQVPYVRPSNDLVEHWRGKLTSLKGFRVGIAWQGNPKHKGDRQRSVPLSQFEPLACVDGVQLVSLQQGAGVEQIGENRNRFTIFDPGALADFMETAALMQNLHLVVTIDSAIAHLAGALAVPVWVALPAVPDWRWLLDRPDSPWYPTTRLFRQARANDWTQCFAQIAEEMKARNKIERPPFDLIH
jgi:cytochrome c-type biogenesis protein CcmH/NrfG